MVRRGSTRRTRIRSGAQDPFLRQADQQATQRAKDERQVALARQKLTEHPEYHHGSTGALMAEAIFQEFVNARKDGPKKKGQVAEEKGNHRFGKEHPLHGGDHQGKRLGRQLARECLWAASLMVYGPDSAPPSAKHTDH